MTEPKGHIVGEHAEHTVMLYALSTCIWCRKTRQLLEDEKVTYDYLYVDLLEGEEGYQALGGGAGRLRKLDSCSRLWGAEASFFIYPTNFHVWDWIAFNPD